MYVISDVEPVISVGRHGRVARWRFRRETSRGFESSRPIMRVFFLFFFVSSRGEIPFEGHVFNRLLSL